MSSKLAAVSQSSRYRPMIRDLAERALGMAVDVSPHRPRQGERRWSLMQSVPAAWRLIDLPCDTPCDPPPTSDPAARFVDGHGHTRPIYRFLAAHLHRRATGDPIHLTPAPDAEPFELLQWRGCLNPDSRSGRQGVPRSLQAEQSGALRAACDAGSQGRDDAEPLHPQGVNHAPDHWTYAELVALHALHNLAQRTGDRALRTRVASAARYHQQHTQPDYTTYQPWALTAFLARPDTVAFAEQQLHDTASHLAIAGPPGALIPGLLLAEAYASLAVDDPTFAA